MTHWAADAYDELILNTHFLWRVFEKTGAALTVDHSRDEYAIPEKFPSNCTYVDGALEAEEIKEAAARVAAQAEAAAAAEADPDGEVDEYDPYAGKMEEDVEEYDDKAVIQGADSNDDDSMYCEGQEDELVGFNAAVKDSGFAVAPTAGSQVIASWRCDDGTDDEGRRFSALVRGFNEEARTCDLLYDDGDVDGDAALSRIAIVASLRAPTTLAGATWWGA